VGSIGGIVVSIASFQWGGAPVVPHRAGARQGLMSRGSPRGGPLAIPHIAEAQQGLKDGGLGEGILVSCGTGSRPGSWWLWIWWHGVGLGPGGQHS
jgi:hypothetical protein